MPACRQVTGSTTPKRPRALMSWSSGKDSAWALHTLRERGDVDVAALLTTFIADTGRVSMHGVRRELVDAQARAIGLPLWAVGLPWPCPNDEYERRMGRVVERARAEGVSHIAFGDLFLEDVRAYRTERLDGTGIEPIFPIWCGREGTHALATDMIEAGLGAVITTVDPSALDRSFAGRDFDADLLASLPTGVDPLGENGEFHTFCHAAPVFDRPIGHAVGGTTDLDGFTYTDVETA